MSKGSDQDQDTGSGFGQFWPGGICGCTSSIGTTRGKEPLWNNRTTRAEPRRTGCHRSRSFALGVTCGGRDQAREGRVGENPGMDSTFQGSTSSLVYHSHYSGARHRFRHLFPNIMSPQIVVAVIVTLLVLFTPHTNAFNVDLKTAVVHTGPKDSMFGYAVAQHIDQQTNW